MIVLFEIAVALFAGLLMSRPAKKLGLPAVTGYLIAGLLIGPFVLGQLGIEGLGFTTSEHVEALGVISDVALGFIAFAIGNEFRVSQLKKIGKQATVIAIFQAIVATIFVDAALIGLHFLMPDKLSISTAITLGAIATATAPAATLMVVNQYKAKGKLTDILLPIVALDDAVGLIVFAVSFGIAKALSSGASLSIFTVAVNPLIEIIGSLLLGSLIGVIFNFSEKFFFSRSKRMCISITYVFLAVAISKLHFAIPGTELEIGFSPLLVCMMLGTIFCNLCEFSEELMAKVDRWTAPLFVLFFVISGAELDLSVFTDWAVIVIGVVYIIFRSAGKISGANISSKFMKCDPSIQKYLGITLLPQAGVALGMSVTVAAELGADGAIIRNIVLFAVLVYELLGPLMTKIALTKAGDIKPKELQPVKHDKNEKPVW
ncbi:MAG: cation:proton antiporter [Clostridia bacterium]|nr:cation:proton antiporter [Clostridia bacterium]